MTPQELRKMTKTVRLVPELSELVADFSEWIEKAQDVKMPAALARELMDIGERVEAL